ncbi:MAG: prepilin-type N-terminal cleavage/methylation domain-containing protein [Elusimicrobiaceae bacterium]|nr:prepilin-type N-terminal cleavage/methylation domain-containing protein [Elusimicrobiaceae bacterium]
MNKNGFTLVEILTAVIIVAILTVMAMPLYEKTIERSRLAEARTIMNRLQEAKLAAMDNMDCGSTYSATSSKCPKMKHLNVAFVQNPGDYTFSTKDFTYSLKSTTSPNGICAKRLGGDYSGTTFLYYQEGETEEVKCKNPSGCNDCCNNYGYDNSSFTCTF